MIAACGIHLDSDRQDLITLVTKQRVQKHENPEGQPSIMMSPVSGTLIHPTQYLGRPFCLLTIPICNTPPECAACNTPAHLLINERDSMAEDLTIIQWQRHTREIVPPFRFRLFLILC